MKVCRFFVNYINLNLFVYEGVVFCVLLSWLFGACTNGRKLSESLLQSSLLQAEENAQELKLVLKHYKDDLQKRKAAEFLIANMYDQVSLDLTSVSNAQPYYDFLAEYVEKNGKYKDFRIYYYFCDSLQKILPRSTRILLNTIDQTRHFCSSVS